MILCVSTYQLAKFVPSAASFAPLNWWMMRSPTCLYWREKAPTTHSPANLPAYGICYRKPTNVWGHVEILAIWDSGSPSIVSTGMSPRNGFAVNHINRWSTEDGASPHKLLGRELVFCRRHPASCGICRQSLLTRNTHYIYIDNNEHRPPEGHIVEK